MPFLAGPVRRSRAIFATSALAGSLAALAPQASAQSIVATGDINTTPPVPITNPWFGQYRFGQNVNSSATLSISGGAQLDARDWHIFGYGAGSDGTLLVDGAGSRYNVDPNLTIGDRGTGNAIITDGGQVSVLNTVTVGNFSIGDIRVAGSGSAFDSATLMFIGYNSRGAMLVEAGATATANDLILGFNPGTRGEVTVTGGNSRFTNSGYLRIGEAGTGALNVLDGGTFAAWTAVLGMNSGSDGTATVSGTGSLLETSGVVSVGVIGTGTLVVADGGHVNVNGGASVLYVTTPLGNGNGAVHIGGAMNAAPAAPGTIDAASITFGGGSGRLFAFNHTSDAYDFAVPFSGDGVVNNYAGTTIISGDSPDFRGALQAQGGELRINGQIGASSRASSSGTGRLGGSGTVGDLFVGATFAPGNSIGTMTVAGDATFYPQGTYEVEIAGDGTSDRTDVGGTAFLGGDVLVIALDPQTSYVDGQTYRILNAGTVSGSFAGVSSTSAFITPTLSYDTNGVDLTIALPALPPVVTPTPTPPPPALFVTAARSSNERGAASALDALAQEGDALAVYNNVLMLSAAEAPEAFDVVSGEIHASGMHASGNATARFAHVLRDQRGNGAWAAPMAAHGEIEADGNAGGFDWDMGGIAGGYTAPLEMAHGNATAGLAFGVTQGDGDARGSSAEVRSLQLGAYAAWAEGPWTVKGSLGLARHDVETERRIAFGAIDRTAQAEYEGTSLGVSGEMQYAIALAVGATVSPLATFDAVRTRLDGATETGAEALNLSFDEETWRQTTIGLGAEFNQQVKVGPGALTLSARAVWEHSLGDTTPERTATLAGSPAAFTVKGAEGAENRLRLELGLEQRLSERTSFTASYEGVFSDAERSHAAQLGVTIRF